jgi:2-dehydro-3-deoxyphosphogluconate aldolase/(4S)-4-hydroxy-2-oxoglutarate aldolase
MLKVPFPQVSFIAAGGVTQTTAFDYIRAGAKVLGVGSELLAREAIRLRKEEQIRELARRFLGIVEQARELLAGG